MSSLGVDDTASMASSAPLSTTSSRPASLASSRATSVAPDRTEVIETDLLIIGAGPAGAGLACFLGSYGLKGIMISAATTTSDTPRAHVTNMATLECLSDLGLDIEVLKSGTDQELFEHSRWARTMTGEEYARIHCYGNVPERAADYEAASPYKYTDCPQNILEPILVRYATQNGFPLRYSTELLSFEREQDGKVLCNLRDNLIKHEYQVRTRYLFGCDGTRSHVLAQLQIPLVMKRAGTTTRSMVIKADLTKACTTSRRANLHWLMEPDEESPPWAFLTCFRMVKPWNEWWVGFVQNPFVPGDFDPTEEDYKRILKKTIGDDSIPFEILSHSRWKVNESYAEYYSDGNVFCLGDAVHQHPPSNGLGSNTSIQDAYNLAWKIALVMKGKASEQILSSYNTERQPVGQQLVEHTNKNLRAHVPIWDALGMINWDLEKRKQDFAELSAGTPGGVARRRKLQEGVRNMVHHFQAIGLEMNQRYNSPSIYLADEEPRAPLPEDGDLYYQISTYPGSRLPHAWLNTKAPGDKFSTVHLAGHRAFCLLTGPGGEKWKEAAEKASATLGIDINTYSIGWGQDYEDVYYDWSQRREVEDDGCVLVRPDRFVGWRSKEMIPDAESKLFTVLKSILGQ